MADSKVILELFYIRHAESAGNTASALISGRDYPVDDPPLTERGAEQAVLLGERMSRGTLDAVICSPLIRAVHTAHEIVKRQEGIRAELLPDLMETDTLPGTLGCCAQLLEERFPLALPCRCEPTPAGGTLAMQPEDFKQKTARGKRCVNYIFSRFNSGERVAVVSHGGFFGFFMRCALGLPEEDIFRWSINNTSVTKIKLYEDGTRKLSYSNDTSHLYASSPDMTYTI